MNTFSRGALALAAAAFAAQAAADITLYERENFEGRATNSGERRIDTIGGLAASINITDSGIWEACDLAYFHGRCVRLAPGRYPTLVSMGLTESVASIRAVNDETRSGETRTERNDIDERDHRRRRAERWWWN